MSCMSALYTFNTASLSDIYFANIFSHSVGCLFILLIVSFTEQKSFSLIQYQMFVFGVVSFAFRVRTPQKPLSVMRRSLPPEFQVLSPFWVNYFIQIMMQFHLFAYCLLIYPSAWSTLLFTQTHAHRVGDAIQPSHPLSSPSPPAPNSSQHQGLFQWVNSSHEMAKVLEFQLQHQSFQRTLRTDLLQDGLVASPCSPRDSQEYRVFFNTTVQKHQFFGAQLSSQSSSHIHTWPLEKP